MEAQTTKKTKRGGKRRKKKEPVSDAIVPAPPRPAIPANVDVVYVTEQPDLANPEFEDFAEVFSRFQISDTLLQSDSAAPGDQHTGQLEKPEPFYNEDDDDDDDDDEPA